MKLEAGNRAAYTRLQFAGVSGLALTAAMVMSFALPAAAQTTDAPKATDGSADKTKEVVVIGVRKSIKSAQQLKKDAATVVDSITATDIGAFPDKSVGEALQRVPGITVSRYASPTDTQHLTGDPAQVLVRGLTQVATQFNGRESFSVNAYRGLNFADVTPELLSGVDVYKNQTSDLVEGGIAGTVNLRTRLPFDQKGQLLTISADYSYADLAKTWDPEASALYSNRWSTSLGEFGLLVDAAYSRAHTHSENLQLGQTIRAAAEYFGTPGTTYIPGGVYFHDANYDRTRKGLSIAGEWKNNDGTMHATLQYNKSEYQNITKERALTYAFATGAYNAEATARLAENDDPNGAYYLPDKFAPATGTAPWTFSANGDLAHATFSDLLGDSGALPNMSDNVDFFTDESGSNDPRHASQTWTQGIYSNQVDNTADTSFHFAWTPADKWKLDFDVQHVDADTGMEYRSAEYTTYSTITGDFTGKHPTFDVDSITPENTKFAPGGGENPMNYFPRDAMDHYEEGTGTADNYRIDGQYKFDTTWADSIQFGVRHSDRETKFYSSAYNWDWTYSNWSNWNSNRTTTATLDSSIYPQNNQVENFNGFYGGGVVNSNTGYLFPNYDLLANRAAFNAAWDGRNLNNGSQQGGWSPICSGAGGGAATRAGETIVGKYGCYKPSEALDTELKSTALYFRFNFGGRDAVLFNGITVSGNIGVRVIHDDTFSTGGKSITTVFSSNPDCGPMTPANSSNGKYIDIACYATAAQLAFANGGDSSLASSASQSYTLPSLNLKFRLNDTWIARFAYAKGMTRPDLAALRDYATISAATDLAGTSLHYTGTLGNPNLKAMTADNYDITLENYFADIGSLTADVFFKKYNNYITSGTGVENVTNGGVTVPVTFTQPVNGKGGTVQGIEVAFQRVFDFLPGIWSGFGAQGSITYVNNTGVDNTGLVGDAAYNHADLINPKALQGISPLSYTATIFYDKGAFAGRLAYAWRDNYLLSVTDSNNPYPFWQKGNGTLDGGLQYRIGDHLVLSLDGSNLLGTENVVLQQVEQGATKNDRNLREYAWQRIDRRYQIGVRYKF